MVEMQSVVSSRIIQQNTNSIQCCEHGYVVFYGALTDFPAIAVLHVVDVSGVDYIAYIAVTDGFDDFIAAVADFRSYSCADAMFFQEFAVPLVASMLKPSS